MPLLTRFAWRKELAQAGALSWMPLPADLRSAAEGLAAEADAALAACGKNAAVRD